TLNRWLVRNMITTVIPDAVVLEAENGHEAVELFLQENPHLVLMDLQMPGKDGYEATKEIRELEGEKETKTPVIALTADAQPETRSASLALGMNEFLTKPVDTKTLRTLLAAYLAGEEEMD
ncbi:MAG: response regulator, partial [Synergistaceae bacterium]|nr:response regulator [Synergistaceae bacterium]